jgi:iron complex transport system substrate-binding protein
MRHGPARPGTTCRRRGVVVLLALAGLSVATIATAHATGMAAAAAPAGASAVEQGRTTDASRAPQRIVSLVPSLTEAVCSLHACARLVGVDRFSNWPAEVATLPRLGGLEDAQVERIVALRPDLVLAAPSARVVGRLRSLGIPVLTLEAKRLADTRRVLESVAVALGTPGAGEAAWRTIEARLDAAAARVPPSLRGRRVYFEIAATPHAAGAASYVGEMLAHLHLANIVPATLGPFPQLSPEFVVRAQPDVVMATAQALAEMPRRPGWSTLAALRNGQACGYAPERFDVLVRPGPRLGEAADLLADCLVGLAARPAPRP